MTEGSNIENKLQLVKASDLTYNGANNLGSLRDHLKNVYGGYLVAQATLAAWETVTTEGATPQSLHSYFVSEAFTDSPIRYEVEKTMDSKSSSKRLVKCYQTTSNNLTFILMISFINKNSVRQKNERYEKDPEHNRFPINFQRNPGKVYEKYRHSMSELPVYQHTNNLFQHAFPPEYLTTQKPKEWVGDNPAYYDLGFFFKVNDENSENPKNAVRARFLQFLMISDSAYFPMVAKALGIPFSEELFTYKNTSLDHAIYFHDLDFEPTEWMYMSFYYSRMSNDRLLMRCNCYTMNGDLFASILQEGLLLFPQKIVERMDIYKQYKGKL